MDLSISFPHSPEQVPDWLLYVVSLVIPAFLIIVICLTFIPLAVSRKGLNRRTVWRTAAWELNTGLMGLALSIAAAYFIINAMKNLFGRPRPDLLSRCNPDLSQLAANTVGSYAELSPSWTLVNSGICRPSSMSTLNAGFRSFPSGHSATSWAGLLYLTLFLCSKFSITIPYLHQRGFSRDERVHKVQNGYEVPTSYITRQNPNEWLNPEQPNTHPALRSRRPETSKDSSEDPLAIGEDPVVPLRNQNAAPPVYLVVLGLVPIAAAIYICSSRFADYRHHPGDIIGGAVIGILCAYGAFRLYHLPIQRGAGWSWAPRSRSRAFGIPIGVGSYVGPESWPTKPSPDSVLNQPEFNRARDEQLERERQSLSRPESHRVNEARNKAPEVHEGPPLPEAPTGALPQQMPSTALNGARSQDIPRPTTAPNGARSRDPSRAPSSRKQSQEAARARWEAEDDFPVS